ncbi:MAG: hypothetical protein ACRENE_11185 [Polyangiaceae bacterium]
MATDVSLAEEGDEQTRPACPTPVDAQVESLKALDAGWYDESSPEYAPASLQWLAKLLTGLLDGFQLPRPYIYPTPEGLARAEWSGSTWEIIISFDLGARSADVIAARNASDELLEITVPLGEPGGESKLGRFLTEHLASGSSELRARWSAEQPGVSPDSERRGAALRRARIVNHPGRLLRAPYRATRSRLSGR